MFEARLVQGNLLKKLVDSIKDVSIVCAPISCLKHVERVSAQRGEPQGAACRCARFDLQRAPPASTWCKPAINVIDVVINS